MLSALLLVVNELWGGISGKNLLKDPERLAMFLGIEMMVEGVGIYCSVYKIKHG